MKNFKISLIFIFVAIFVTVVFIFSWFTYTSTIVINGKKYNVEIAETKYFLEKGLSGHTPLKNDEGMFFIFEKPDKYGFWMKDMTFPIDIVWVDQNFRVSHIEKAVSPQTYPKIFYPESPSMYVLEIASGQSDLANIKIGDFVKFERKV